MFNNKRINIIAGHYGSGKTTFSINYALSLSESTKKHIYLADLDVVNPYFRSREYKEFLSQNNIEILGSYIYHKGSDLPAVSADVLKMFSNKDGLGIVDLGGNAVGSNAFGIFKDSVNKEETNLFFILNASRGETSTLDGALIHMTSLEYSLNMKFTAIINNTHLMEYTTIDVIEEGEKLSSELSINKNIPVIYTCLSKEFLDKNKDIKTKYKPFLLGFDIKDNSLVN